MSEQGPGSKESSGSKTRRSASSSSANSSRAEAGSDVAAAMDVGSGDAAAQNEIDRLMGGSADPLAVGGQNGMEALADAALLPVNRYPLLRIVGEAFVKLLGQELRHSSSTLVETTLIAIMNVRLGGLVAALPSPCLIAVVTSSTLEGIGLVSIDSSLASAYFDALLGGPQARPFQPAKMRPYSVIETRLFSRFADIAAVCLGNAFTTLSKVDFAVERIETNPRSLVLGKASENAVRIRLRCQFGTRGGFIDCFLPMKTLAPIKHELHPPSVTVKVDADPAWRSHLLKTASLMRFDLDVVLNEFRLPLRKILDLKVGETVMLDMRTDAPVNIRSGGCVIGSALMGRSGDRLAVRLTGPISAMSHLNERIP